MEWHFNEHRGPRGVHELRDRGVVLAIAVDEYPNPLYVVGDRPRAYGDEEGIVYVTSLDEAKTLAEAAVAASPRPLPVVTCARCGHRADFDGDPSREILRCDKCQAITAFGALQPRVIILPAADPRFILLRVDGVQALLARPYGAIVARELLSVCKPPAVAPASPCPTDGPLPPSPLAPSS